VVFEGQAGTGTVRTRTRAYQDRRRAAELLGDSPEAWFIAGDYVYHFGNPVVGFDSTVALARQFFSLAVALDTQPVFLFHLSEIALNTNDTALMRRLLPAYQGVEGEERWIHHYLLATVLGDTRLVDSLRRAGPPKDWGFGTIGAVATAVDSRISLAQFDDLVHVLALTHASAPLAFVGAMVNAARGRLPAPRSLPPFSPEFNPVLVSGDPVDSVFLHMFSGPAPKESTVGIGESCIRALLVVERGGPAPTDTVSVPNARCRAVLRAYDAFNKGTLTDSALTRLDTLATIGNFGTFMGFEHRLLARIYEARGDTARAVRAIQLYPRDYGGVFTAPTQREAGRLFLISRDTARAIAAYEHYLRLRTDALPPLVAERDSVKAIVSKLKTRFTP